MIRLGGSIDAIGARLKEESGIGTILARAATITALPTNVLTGNVLEASAEAALPPQDGILLSVGDRLLVKNEGEGRKNGVYTVTSLGSGAANWKLTRIAAMDESAEVVGGMQVYVLQGTQNGGVAFSLLTTGAITLGTTALTFGYAREWVAPGAFLNSWANFEAAGTNMPVAYRKGPDGRVTTRGLVKHEGSLTAGVASAILALPVGLRPSKSLIFPCVYSAAAGLLAAHVAVEASGQVVFAPGATGAVTYAPMNYTFYAD